MLESATQSLSDRAVRVFESSLQCALYLRRRHWSECATMGRTCLPTMWTMVMLHPTNEGPAPCWRRSMRGGHDATGLCEALRWAGVPMGSCAIDWQDQSL